MNIIGFVVLILMYVTRPQAIIYIFGLLFLYFLLNYPLKKALSYAVGVIAISLVTLLATSKQGLFAVTQHLPGVAPSDALRGRIQNVGILEISKKLFYNLYNFYRLLPQIASPYMWGLFVIGSFHWTKNKVENSLKATTIFTVVATFLAAALTIPFFRYLHPVVPLVYLFAVSTLVWIVETVVSVQWSVFSAWLKNRSPFTVHRTHVVAIVSTVLILFFVVGQTLGVIFLDSRFKAKRVNRGKPPVYVQLSHILRGNTSQDDVVVTNLDTWGSWYGERKTVWYPLQPNQLAGLEDTIDAIFLTSYLIDDENYYMGREWRQAFLNPENIGDSFISENFDFKGIYTIKPEETNEKQEGRAVLFVKKSKNSKL